MTAQVAYPDAGEFAYLSQSALMYQHMLPYESICMLASVDIKFQAYAAYANICQHVLAFVITFLQMPSSSGIWQHMLTYAIIQGHVPTYASIS
jgi:hypothetical protein